MWETIHLGRITHILPTSDAVEHVPRGNCICGPGRKAKPAMDGLWTVTVQHHALDGRATPATKG